MAGLRPAPAEAEAEATAKAGYPWDGGVGPVAGRRRKPIHGGLAAASMPRTPPQPDPPRLRRFLAICSRSSPCVDESLSDNEINRGQSRFPKENGSDPMTPRDSTLHPAVTGKLSMVGRCGLGRTDGAMDGAIEPPWVRALCLRSTASQAPERTAASGWAGPRRGVYGVSCQPTPPRQTIGKPEPLWLWPLLWVWPLPWLIAGAGRSPADPPSPAHENVSTVFSKPSSLRHASTILRSSMRPQATHAKKRPPIA